MKILLSLITFLLFTTSSWATTYHIRTDGGTGTQCTGLSNNGYDAGAHGTDCALNHPNWTFPPRGESTTRKAGTGDTVIIHGGDIGGSPQYRIGCQGTANCRDASVNLTAGYCDSSAPGDCIMSDGSASLVGIPSNVTVIGCSATGCGCAPVYSSGRWTTQCTYTRPQLWGAGKIGWILRASSVSTGVVIQDLELTDHSGCGYRLGTPSCDETKDSLAAQVGINVSGATSLTMKNLWMHGIGSSAMTGHTAGTIVFDNVNMDKNVSAGWNGDDGTGTTGSLMFKNHSFITFSGCIEAYPITGNPNERTDVVYCVDQNSAGYGDGLGFADGTTTDITMQDSECSHNVQDCMDMLHSNLLTGTAAWYRMKSEGNDGQGFKSSLKNNIIENSIFIHNCKYFTDAGFPKNGSFADCRANGTSINIAASAGSNLTIKNSSLIGGNIAVEWSGKSDACDGTEIVDIKNTLYYGVLSPTGSGSQTDPFYCSGKTGSGDGACCVAHPPTQTYANVINFHTKHSITGTAINTSDPHIAAGDNLGSIGDTDYFNFYLTASSSNAIGQADNTVTGTSDLSIDYNSYSRGVAWDIGGVEYGSVPTGGGSSSTTGSYLYNITPTGSIKFQ